jgi:hypothetical protein
MILIETKTLGTTAASIEFTSIPQTLTDLVVVISARTSASATSEELLLHLNGSSASFTSIFLYGNPPGGNAPSGSGGLTAGNASGNTSTANTFGSSNVYIPNYTSSTNKSFSVESVSEHNGNAAFPFLVAGLWSNTAAITSLLVKPGVNNFLAGTTISLYGILKGSSGGVVVS